MLIKAGNENCNIGLIAVILLPTKTSLLEARLIQLLWYIGHFSYQYIQIDAIFVHISHWQLNARNKMEQQKM